MAQLRHATATSSKCQHYAKFASHLDRAHFDVIYWMLFILVIFMLFTASWRYGRYVGRASGPADLADHPPASSFPVSADHRVPRSVDAVEKYEAGSPEHERKMKQCMLVCGIYAVVSVVAVVMGVDALMALQFCDGEDLMALYWSTWTVMQIGSLIAIFASCSPSSTPSAAASIRVLNPSPLHAL